MARSVNVFALSTLALCAMEILASAGDQVVPSDQTPPPPERKEFHLTIEYPFVFRPASYLQTQQPVAMRYGEPALDDSSRNAPPLPASAKGVDEAKKTEEARIAAEKAAAAATPTPAPKPEQPLRVVTAAPQDGPQPGYPAAYPVPQDAPTPIPKGAADFSKTPDEVEGYFRNQYNFVPDSHRFFDPIFEPANAPVPPQPAAAGPKSTATYTETP